MNIGPIINQEEKQYIAAHYKRMTDEEIATILNKARIRRGDCILKACAIQKYRKSANMIKKAGRRSK
jgi:hypothetical protein